MMNCIPCGIAMKGASKKRAADILPWLAEIIGKQLSLRLGVMIIGTLENTTQLYIRRV